MYKGAWKNGKKDEKASQSGGHLRNHFGSVKLERAGESANTGKSTVHVILFTDTDDSRVGSSSEETNRYFKKTFVPKLVAYSGMDVKSYYYSGAQFTLVSLLQFVEGLSTSGDDVIFFYYAGHGYNRGESPYPTITFGKSGPLASRQIDLSKLYQTLQAKPHRLLCVLAEACNKVYAARNRMRLENKVSNFNPRADEGIHYRELFAEASGDYIMSSSSREQLSHLATGQPGFFTCAFRDAFASYVDESYVAKATWPLVFDRAKANTISSARQIGEKQEPQWAAGNSQ